LGGKRKDEFTGDWVTKHGVSEDGNSEDGATKDGITKVGVSEADIFKSGNVADGVKEGGTAGTVVVDDPTAGVCAAIIVNVPRSCDIGEAVVNGVKEDGTVEAVVMSDPTVAVCAAIVVNVPRSCNFGGIRVVGVGAAEGAGWGSNGKDKGKLSHSASPTGCDRFGVQESDQESVNTLVPLVEG
jgi:hypothetical protein